jgi:transcriptional regulator with XRE-family HTH domain
VNVGAPLTLAQQIDSDHSYMNRVETGKANPSFPILTRIGDALETSLDQLVRSNGDSPEIRIRDESLLERVLLIETLDHDDHGALVQMIDAMLTKIRMRELLDGGQGR